jgi:hypothetical protein
MNATSGDVCRLGSEFAGIDVDMAVTYLYVW